MSLPLPNLDDRRWSDLVEEGRALIPLYEREWSDHNIHDPGIMLLELLAWVTEMDIYWLNRVPESHRRKFLALAGFHPASPQPARTVLQILLKQNSSPLTVPIGLQFAGDDAIGRPATFRTLHDITLAPGRLQVVQRREGNRWSNLTARQQRGEIFAPFGEDPQPGVTFYLGFSDPLPPGKPVTLYFTFARNQAGESTRERLATERRRRLAACRPADELIHCSPDMRPSHADPEPESDDRRPWSHHSAHLIWEYLDEAERWQPLDPQTGEIWDDTRAATLNGAVVIRVPGKMKAKSVGQVEKPLYYVSCRLDRGAFDAPPQVQNLALNGVLAEQAAHSEVHTWPIVSQAKIDGLEPRRGQATGFKAVFDDEGRITRLHFHRTGPPGFQVLAYRPPQGDQPGRLRLKAEALRAGDGRPWQKRSLAHAPVQAASLQLFTWEGNQWIAWQTVDDLDASGRADAHCVLDATAGELHFGDGEHGRVLPSGALPLVSYRATQAEAGNLPAGAVNRLLDNAHNRALVGGSLSAWRDRIGEISNRLPAAGGTPAETLNETTARTLDSLRQSERAVTLDDYRALAMETPGVQLARVAAIPNMHPAFPCLRAPGIITLIVLPFLPEERPMPSQGLLVAVQAYLASRRVLGTRVDVVAPHYTPVAVSARVRACATANLVELQATIVTALNQFFHPLHGGPDGDGWPLGRDVYRSEVLQVIDKVPGVDHVLSLDLLGADGEPTCGNLCLGTLGLPATVEHHIEVV